MKKIIVFLFLLVLLALSFHFETKNVNLLTYFSDGFCEFYVKKESNKTIPEFASATPNGANLFVRADIKLGLYLQSQLNDIIGLTTFVSGDENDIINNLKVKICKKETIGEYEHILGFSPYFDDFIFTNGKKTNIHIVVCGDRLIIGSPIIYGSY